MWAWARFSNGPSPGNWEVYAPAPNFKIMTSPLGRVTRQTKCPASHQVHLQAIKSVCTFLIPSSWLAVPPLLPVVMYENNWSPKCYHPSDGNWTVVHSYLKFQIISYYFGNRMSHEFPSTVTADETKAIRFLCQLVCWLNWYVECQFSFMTEFVQQTYSQLCFEDAHFHQPFICVLLINRAHYNFNFVSGAASSSFEHKDPVPSKASAKYALLTHCYKTVIFEKEKGRTWGLNKEVLPSHAK